MNYRKPSLSINERVMDLISQMTLEEKVSQLRSCWIYDLQTKGQLDKEKISRWMHHGIGQITRLSGSSVYNPIQAAKAANQIQRELVQETRLGIPAIIHEECCSGCIALGATIFPQMIGLAGTFRPELAEKMTAEIRKQLMAVGARQGLAPMLDVARDPRWGRVEETFGEDPLLISQFGVSYIRGLQGDQLKDGVIATGKHFVGHSLSQGGLNCAPTMLGERTLWDVYLLPFQAAIRDANLASIMNAYPELDGEVVATSRKILTEVLRGELGFNGLLVSDYQSIQMIHDYYRAAASYIEAAAMALRAGIEVELPTVHCLTGEFVDAVEAGKIEIELVNQAVRRHLEKKFELGLFENPYVDENRVLEVFETPEQRELALEIARESMVLLTNDGTLPVSKAVQTVAVIGPNADDSRNLIGDYSYASMSKLLEYNHPANSAFVNPDWAWVQSQQVKMPSVLEAIRAKMPDVNVLYARGCDVNSTDTGGFAEAVATARKADVVVLVLGDKSGLTPECTCGETRDSADLKLPGKQEELVKAVLTAGKPVVVVLINGRPLAIPALAESANAILEAWFPGEEGGRAIADVLSGDVNPGGKLVMTFPRSVGQLPIYYNHKPSGLFSNFYTNYVSESVKPLFPFGHGLSYSKFEYAGLVISKSQATVNENLDISCTVTNASNLAGDEVVQLYLQDEYASLPRPVKELKGFKKIYLEPGQSKSVVFHLPVNIMAFYDRGLKLQLEPGNIKVMIGSSSQDIRLNGQFEVVGTPNMPVNKREYICPVDVQ